MIPKQAILETVDGVMTGPLTSDSNKSLEISKQKNIKRTHWSPWPAGTGAAGFEGPGLGPGPSLAS